MVVATVTLVVGTMRGTGFADRRAAPPPLQPLATIAPSKISRPKAGRHLTVAGRIAEHQRSLVHESPHNARSGEVLRVPIAAVRASRN